MYLANANLQNAKYILLVYDNDSIVLKWCCGDIIMIQENPSITKVGRKIILEYGEVNLLGTRRNLPFQDEQGKLEKIWEKIL
jgi:hypothetical protein